jgi:hypothetical protein
MQKLKLAAFAVALVLVAGASISLQAQKRTRTPLKIEPPIFIGNVLTGSYSSNVNATELSPGQADYGSNEMYGATSYGQTKGDLSGHVFMSMNYSLPSLSHVDPDAAVNAFQSPQSCEVTGGSWSQVIYVDGAYTGSVFGRIVGGTVTWSGFGQSVVSLKLVADGGTDAYLGSSGNGDFAGTIDRSGNVPTVNGTLTLNY